MSGSPRSTIRTSGWRLAASTRPSSPVTASNTRYPWPVSAARRNFRICGSSSTTTMQGSAIGGHRGAGGLDPRQWEQEHGAPLRQILCPELPPPGGGEAPPDRRPPPPPPPPP